MKMTAEDIKQRYYYDTTSPTLIRHACDKNKKTLQGDIAGTIYNGTPRIYLKNNDGENECIPMTWVILMLHDHPTPTSRKECVGYKDGNKGNWRIENLYITPKSVSVMKSRGKIGFTRKGPHRFYANITYQGVRKSLGYHKTSKQAKMAYDTAKTALLKEVDQHD